MRHLIGDDDRKSKGVVHLESKTKGISVVQCGEFELEVQQLCVSEEYKPFGRVRLADRIGTRPIVF